MKTQIKISQSIAVFILLFALLLSACAASPEERTVETIALEAAPEAEEIILGDTVDVEMQEASAPEMDKAEGGVNANTSLPAAQQRLILMNAEMILVVKDPSKVMDFVAEMAQGYGGFVVSSNLQQVQGNYGTVIPQANITVRVPAQRLQQALGEIENLALEVVSKNQSGKDVTREYTDLQSRLRNLEKAEEQLTLVMQEAVRTEDVLRVYNELTKVTEQAEVIRGQIKYYEESSAFSAISLVLRAEEIAPPVVDDKPAWKPGMIAQRALADLKLSLQRWTNGAIRFLLYSLPMLVFRLGPWVIVFWLGYRFLIRPWVKKRQQKKIVEEE